MLVGLFITVAYLLLHPFKLFQKCFGELKFKKDLILSVTDVFNGPFKDGTSENSWDYRYFAGMHFAIQLLVMSFYYIPLEHQLVTGILKVILCSLFILAILIFKPYKRNIHNFSEVILFALLTGLSVFPALAFDLYGDYWKFTILFLGITPILGFIIIAIVTPYCMIWMIRKFRHCCKYVKGNYPNHNYIPMEDREELITNYVHLADDEENFVFPDRLENPKKYNVIVNRGPRYRCEQIILLGFLKKTERNYYARVPLCVYYFIVVCLVYFAYYGHSLIIIDDQEMPSLLH